jgi:citrate lyase subunit beta/citryl-CoA lyase
MLYVPGNNPGMIKDSVIYNTDCIMFDLEDSVAIAEKDAARFLVYEALRTLDPSGKEFLVRINTLESGLGVKDLEAVVRTKAAAVRLPKAESAKDVIDCERDIERIERENGIETGSTRMMAAVESAAGALNAKEIALASKRLIAIAIGAEDYVTDLKTNRSPDGAELMLGRGLVLLAARAAGIDAIDTVYSDVDNTEGFYNEVRLIKQMGFDGKSIINPRQIGPVHEVFTPSEKDIEKSLRVIEAMEEAERKGSGVISLNGKMVDKPIVLRAQRVLDLAKVSGLSQRTVAMEEAGNE